MSDQSRFLTLNECAAMLGVSRVTLFRWRQLGTFPEPLHLQPNGRGKLLFERADIEAWLAGLRRQIKSLEHTNVPEGLSSNQSDAQILARPVPAGRRHE